MTDTISPVGTSPSWHSLTVDEVAQQLAVDPAVGLSADEARRRLAQSGPNRVAAAPPESGLLAFLRQYRDFMQVLPLGAAVLNIVVTGDWGTTIVLLLLTVFNAVLGRAVRGQPSPSSPERRAS